MANKGTVKEQRLTHKVFARVTEEKYKELSDLLEHSRCRTLSELVRHILMHEQIVTVTYDRTIDKVMEMLSGIRKELHAIGININQVTREYHTATSPDGKLYNALEVAKLYQQTDGKVTELFTIISNLSEQWLPRS